MRWQDVVFTIGSIVFCITLVPMLRAEHKPPLITSVPIGAFLYIFAFAYLTLGFVAAPIIEFIQATAWMWLAVQGASGVRRRKTACGTASDEGSTPSAST